MKLNHVALNVQDEKELVDFYNSTLGFHLEYQFDMPAELALSIFEIKKPIKVFLYKKEDMVLELFVNPDKSALGFTHLCMEVSNRDSIAAKCEQNSYPVIKIKRNDKQDLLFIKDRAGNIFELKDSN